ncbi:MAG: hypothetical protein HZC28_06080 [Spirochaetes bacterium]|nr:hypothetical protein [Spirochaetota bacterium]
MWKTISLEITLKPFCFDMSDAGFEKTGLKLFRQWEPLWINGGDTQLMFWTGDGSELLEYTGDLSDTMEYARYCGSANMWDEHTSDKPRETQTMHQVTRLFMEKPPVWTYADLKRLISVLKKTYRSRYGRDLKIGTTFDPGPEFARSDFKYNRHPEILSNMLGKKIFIFCYSVLNADKYRYAAYPDGIPQGESFGTFIGKQSQIFLRDIDFDFIWFSNGFGFGTETWGVTGAVFDGEKFYPDNTRETGKKVFQFWNDFRKNCPDYPIETRGTNLTTGIDLASDAVPLREIYNDIKNIEAPPNSPWAALDHNFGLELAGMLSHIAELPPGKGYPFRLYTHDPWWLNSPWLDRYDRMPHDIYMPMAVSRLNANGDTENPSRLNLLSVDDTWGNLPDQVPQEALPHLIDAYRTAPDQAGPLVWLYPFDEYHDHVAKGQRLEEVMFGDFQIIGAINEGLPLNTVVSTRNFNNMPLDKIAGRILITPTLVSDETVDRLTAFVKQGGKVLFYGPAHGEKIEQLLELEPAEPISGELEIPGCGKVRHTSVHSGGPIDRKLRKDAQAETLHEYVQGNVRRPAAARNGNIIWLRGTNSFKKVSRSAEYLPRTDYFFVEGMYRDLLNHFGWQFDFVKYDSAVLSPRITVRIHDNAFYYAGFGTNSTVVQHLSTPDGVPLFRGRDVILENGYGVYQTEKVSNLEARIFVRGENGVMQCREMTHENIGENRRMQISGLKNATVTFRPTGTNAETVIFTKNARLHTIYEPSDYTFETTSDAFGVKYIVHNVTGELCVTWGARVKEYFPGDFSVKG